MSRSRLYYRKNPESVVIEKDGKVVTSYRNAEELVETHMKGMLAKDQQASKKIREMIKKARPTDALNR